MQQLPGCAVLAAILTLFGHPAATAPDPEQFDRLCTELLDRVAQQDRVKFENGSANLSTKSLGLLDEIVEVATDCPALSIKVTGHTDDTGNAIFNRDLSKARADAVISYLVRRGIEGDRLTAIGAGSTRPIASNDDAAGRQANRRIEFEIYSLPCNPASSTSNTSVAPGGMTFPAPRSP